MEAIILLVGAISGSLVTIIYACFSSIRKSRCVSVDCGCIHCRRDLMSAQEFDADLKHDDNLFTLNRNTLFDFKTRAAAESSKNKSMNNEQQAL